MLGKLEHQVASPPSADEIRLTFVELEQRLRRVEPSALLVRPRILRRVIKLDRNLDGLSVRVPHRQGYVIGSRALLNVTTLLELGLQSPMPTETVFLLPRPDYAQLLPTNTPRLLRHYWRLLFHLSVHHELDRLQLDEQTVQDRIRQVGMENFAEARFVLEQEQVLLDPSSDRETYHEFVATFFELYYFDRHRLHYYFPRIEDVERVVTILANDLNLEAILERTHLEGAATTEERVEIVSEESESGESNEKNLLSWLRDRADDASRRGNHVRAALLRLRAARRVPATQAGSWRGPARLEIDKLAERVCKALQLPEREREIWSRTLWEVADGAGRGVWNQEMRFLTDLQIVCLDNEREIFSADLIEWFVTWFRRPIKRSLPDLPLVLTVQRLRQAQGRLPLIRISAEAHNRLSESLGSAIAQAELRMRNTFRPQLLESFDRVGLIPNNAAERLSRDKLIEELLDEVGHNGYLTLSDLRDALARNRLKLGDLNNPLEILTGDQLIRLNRELAVQLDGVYRRGEIYLRWLQRLSSLFFGNPVGRFLTLYLLLPLLGSLFILKGIEGITDEVHHWVIAPIVGVESHEEPSAAPESAEEALEQKKRPPILPLFNTVSFLTVALLILLLMHVPTFRRGFLRGLWYVWRGVRGILYDLPRLFFRLPMLRAIFESKTYLLFKQYLGKPILWTLPFAWILHRQHLPTTSLVTWSVVFCVWVSVLLNSRLGQLLEEIVLDWMIRTWNLIRDDLLPGTFRWIVWVSKKFLERIERIRYTVVEWLLFRRGQSRVLFWLKLLVGLPWFAISYVVRFCLMVLIEPQVNPIKHFPVVTVSHKLMLVIAPPIASALSSQMGWSFDGTLGMVIMVMSLIPGLFGFLAWELKENWKLYRANQPASITPEMVGSHGEYVINYLRPGFHSGTLPSLFARLRKAQSTTLRKNEEALHHVEAEVERFVQRELIAPLVASKKWLVSATVAISHVHLSTNSIRVALDCPGLSAETCSFRFDYREGELYARFVDVGWIHQLDVSMKTTMSNCLIGFYKRAGVDWIEPFEGQQPFHYAQRPVSWQEWVQCWERDLSAEPTEPLVPAVQILPG